MLPNLLGLALLIGQAPDAPSAFIDRELAARWTVEKLTPAAKTTDHEFLRRASLDLIGRIPTLAEQQTYLKEAPAQRRRLLVDRLLSHEDYATNWANLWTDWLLASAGDPDARQAFHGWLEQHFAKNGSHKALAEKLLTATGNSQENPALHFYVALRGQAFRIEDWKTYGQHDMIPLTGQVFRAMHGKRLQCMACHDSAFDDELRRDHFHGMNLFFRQVQITLTPIGTKKIGRKKVPIFRAEVRDHPDLAATVPLGRLSLHQWLSLQPTFYGGERWKPVLKQTRRGFFAERFVKHPDFARAHVNFVWTHLFGRSLTQTTEFDDMGSHNPIVHEELMARLATEFVKSGHDPKALLRWICNSETYGLQSVANETNHGPETAVYFSRMQARPMTRHQFVESLAVALTGSDYAKRRTELRLNLLRDLKWMPSTDRSDCEVPPLDGESGLSVQMALWAMFGDQLEREIGDSKTVADVLKRHGPASYPSLRRIVPDLFEITLCRPPTVREMKQLSNPATINPRPGFKQLPTTPQFWSDYTSDIFWALLNCNEFALNH